MTQAYCRAGRAPAGPARPRHARPARAPARDARRLAPAPRQRPRRGARDPRPPADRALPARPAARAVRSRHHRGALRAAPRYPGTRVSASGRGPNDKRAARSPYLPLHECRTRHRTARFSTVRPLHARAQRRPEGGPRLAPRLRRRRHPPGRRRVGRARGDSLAGHPGGRQDRPLLPRLLRPAVLRPHRSRLPMAMEELFWGDAGIALSIVGTAWPPSASSPTAPRSRSAPGSRRCTATPTT